MVSSSQKTPRRGATTQRNKATKTSRAPMPGWLWALGGLVVGFFLAHYQNGTAPWQDDPASGPEATVISREQRDDSAAEGAAEDDEASMPTFEFYTLLPETEVIAPGGVVPSTVVQPEPAPAATPAEEVASNASDTSGQLTEDEQSAMPDEPIASSTPVSDDDPIAELIAANNTENSAENTEQNTATSQPEAPAAQAEQARYMLQAASFRSETDAGRMRDRLKNLSLLAHISKVQANGNTWHRVQVGPYDDPRELNRAQDLMNTQGIEPLLIQLQN
ncbi:SPOR domain-containing protein [Halomonas sp. LS-001]